jgi:hypothetical protein
VKKLRLNPDEVTVLSFETGEERPAGGTVVGNAISTRPCGPPTEYYTCGIVCFNSQNTSPCLCQ